MLIIPFPESRIPAEFILIVAQFSTGIHESGEGKIGINLIKRVTMYKEQTYGARMFGNLLCVFVWPFGQT